MRMFGSVPSTANLRASEEAIALAASRATRQQPGQSLIASARRITSETLKSRRGRIGQQAAWQDDAWAMHDLVGEQRFLAHTLAGRLAQARLYVGRIAGGTDEPEPVDDPAIQYVLESLGDGDVGRAQIIHRLGVNLFIAGDGWIAGIPSSLMPEEVRQGEVDPNYTPGDLILEDLEWRMLSVHEVSSDGTDRVSLALDDGVSLKVDPDHVYLIRVWRPHPRRFWEADSPVRSNLPVLRELVGLTMHISAQVDSRLAGAGVFLVPETAARAIKAQMGMDEDSEDDPFTDALIEAMVTPIEDRASASAVVPLVITAPDESIEKFRHISFASELDDEARELRDESIRRLALGQDAPPELLLGTGGMNHWGAWLVREDVVTTHLEPPLALICDALTTQYLRPILESKGVENPQDYVIWYDVNHLITRPNRASDAMNLHERGVISDEALLDATGFDHSDAPEADQIDPAIATVISMVQSAPTLAVEPGLDELYRQVSAMMSGEVPAPTEEPASEPETPAGEPPEESEPEADTPPNLAAKPAKNGDFRPKNPVFGPKNRDFEPKTGIFAEESSR